MKKQKSDILHLTLKGKWYDMIASGEKREEYRDKDYWTNRIIDQDAYDGFLAEDDGKTEVKGTLVPLRRFVCFHRGYTNTTMTFKIAALDYGKPNPNWCDAEDADKEFIIIKLGDRVSNGASV